MASIIMVTDRACTAGYDEAAARVAAALIKAEGYLLVGCALVPDEPLLIEAAIARHAQELMCTLVVVLDAGRDALREQTLSALGAACELMMAERQSAACGLVDHTVVAALPGAARTLGQRLSRMLPSLSRKAGVPLASGQMA